MKRVIYLIFLSSILLSCASKSKFRPNIKKVGFNGQILEWHYDQNGKLIFNEPMRQFFSAWTGNAGLLNSRNEYEEIFPGGTFFVGMKREDMIQYMGMDEVKKENKLAESLTYYTEGNCNSPDSDCCWIDFYFDKNGLVVNYLMACT